MILDKTGGLEETEDRFQIEASSAIPSGSGLYTPRKLEVCTHVLVRIGSTRKPLESPNEGSYKVFECEEHAFSLDVSGKPKTASLSKGRCH